jgi:hypothetical protein
VLCRASSGGSSFRDSLDLTSPANLKKLQIIRNEYVTTWIQKHWLNLSPMQTHIDSLIITIIRSLAMVTELYMQMLYLV